MPLFLFLLFLFSKQFYIQSSGMAGMADISLILCFITLLGTRLKYGGKYISREKQTWRLDVFLYVFIFFALVINMLYAIWEGTNDFLIYTLYWLYNGMAIWTFRYVGEQNGFIIWTRRILKLNILLQTGIWLFGFGRLFHESWGGIRYMGTFNDPNQLAFFMFLMLLLLYLCQGEKRDRSSGIFYIFAVSIIIASKSTGVFLGVMVFFACAGMQKFCRYYSWGKSRKLIWLFCGLIAIFILILFCCYSPADFSIQEESFTLLKRIEEKIWKLKDGGIKGVFYDRGMEKLVLYPEYLLYGAGEGGFERFSLASQINEIHSCFFSIWFCYGILPTLMILFWLYRQVKLLKDWMWPAVLALLAESFFLINYRQPLFWLVLIYGGITLSPVHLNKKNIDMGNKELVQ